MKSEKPCQRTVPLWLHCCPEIFCKNLERMINWTMSKLSGQFNHLDNVQIIWTLSSPSDMFSHCWVKLKRWSPYYHKYDFEIEVAYDIYHFNIKENSYDECLYKQTNIETTLLICPFIILDVKIWFEVVSVLSYLRSNLKQCCTWDIIICLKCNLYKFLWVRRGALIVLRYLNERTNQWLDGAAGS